MIRRLLHLAEDNDTSGFFPQLGRWHDRNRYAMWFGTLRPIAPWLKAHMEAHGVRTLSLDCRSRGDYPSALLRLAQVLKDEEIDILHTHLFDPSVVGLAAGVLAGTRIRVVTRHYSDYHTRIHKRWHVRLDQFCTWSAHAVVAVSEHTAEHLRNAENAPPEKVHVIPNGIDFERVRISSDDAVARIRHEFGAGHALLLIAARLHPEKGYEYLFAALPEIARRFGDGFRLLIAGTGTLEQTYRERVRTLGCGHLVHFLGFRRDLPDLMAAADLFVLPSVAEAFGLVLAEALYLGTPVIATRTGGIPEIVDDGIHGVLVPPGNSPALAEAIGNLLADEATRRRMRGSGRDKVRQQFRFDAMLQRYEALYESLAAARA